MIVSGECGAFMVDGGQIGACLQWRSEPDRTAMQVHGGLTPDKRFVRYRARRYWFNQPDIPEEFDLMLFARDESGQVWRIRCKAAFDQVERAFLPETLIEEPMEILSLTEPKEAPLRVLFR